jgi:hypothetical protein
MGTRERLMPMLLSPRPGFDWLRVTWGAPDQTRTEKCSYCDQALDHETSVPLILWNKEGWCAEFCDDCQARWWGLCGVSAPVDPKQAYRDDSYPSRNCDYCGLRYRGPAVYCSIECAIADA